jgi:hypothetical protein
MVLLSLNRFGRVGTADCDVDTVDSDRAGFASKAAQLTLRSASARALAVSKPAVPAADVEEPDANFVVVSDSFRRPQKLVF